ncbi:MAG TPA: 6-carboxytetrahydropterin synthase [Gemmatirosa sp.]|nr:6-carboxytetrahydropterin synthase [Gemmatirosa sp.]
MPSVTVTRRLRFNAAHRIHNPALSDAENTALYGKCNNPNWHGHNYVLEVSVRGEVDPRTGYVVDLGALRDVVEREVIDVMDHRNLNLDVPFMQGVNPTSENIVVQCWRVIEPHVAPARLARLRLWETENNYVEYEGQ